MSEWWRIATDWWNNSGEANKIIANTISFVLGGALVGFWKSVVHIFEKIFIKPKAILLEDFLSIDARISKPDKGIVKIFVDVSNSADTKKTIDLKVAITDEYGEPKHLMSGPYFRSNCDIPANETRRFYVARLRDPHDRIICLIDASSTDGKDNFRREIFLN